MSLMNDIWDWMIQHPVEYVLICILEALLIFVLVNTVDFFLEKRKGSI